LLIGCVVSRDPSAGRQRVLTVFSGRTVKKKGLFYLYEALASVSQIPHHLPENSAGTMALSRSFHPNIKRRFKQQDLPRPDDDSMRAGLLSSKLADEDFS